MPGTKVVERFGARIGLRPHVGPAAVRHEVLRYMQRLAVLIAAVTALLIVGAIAYSLFEDVSGWQGFNWSLDTIATVGSVPSPDTLGGQITKIVLITLGVGTMFFLLVTLTELFVAGDLSGLLEARRMQRKIAELRDHYLICGFGRVGRQIARDLRASRVPFVVVDENPEVREWIEELDVLHIEGRASDDEILREAGIERARAVIACVDSDAENIFATLTARELRPDIQIVARASEDSSERKLIRAGADDVISPYKTSGRAMAKLALKERGLGSDGAMPGVPVRSAAETRDATSTT
jgi:voltage-gated potassium channel